MKINVIPSPVQMTRTAAALCMMAGRLCLAALFLAGALQKAVAPQAAETLLIANGLTPLLIWPALIFNAFGAACLMLGLWLAPMAFLLALYCMATSLFHYLPDDPWQMSILIKNWAVAGGLLVLAAHEVLHPRG